MTSARTYEYLTDFISRSVLAERDIDETLKYAKGNGKPSKGVTAHLSDAIETHMYRCRDKCILVDASGSLFAFNGQWWERIEQPNFMRELIKRILAAIGVSVTYRTYSVDKIAAECMSGLTASDDTLFTPDRRYIAFTNGVFDLKTGDFKDFHPRYTTDIVLDFAYKSDAEGYLYSNPERDRFKLWDRKIEEIFDAPGHREAFQKFCGSLLADRSEFKVEYICFLEGPGANGKSVVAHAVANLFGKRYFGKYSPDQLLRGPRSDRYTADLMGKLCNLCDDLDDKVISGGEFKRMVSGEEIQGMKAYARNPVMGKLPLFICCTNSTPITKDDTYGDHRRRLRLLTTRRRFGEDCPKDPRLTSKLAEEPCRQRIFNWLYEGYRKVIARNGVIELPPEVVKAMEEMRDESTPRRRWASERGISKKKEPTAEWRWTLLTTVNNDFLQWCSDNGVDYQRERDSRLMSAFLQNLNYEGKPSGRGKVFLLPPLPEWN